ncbi:MAG: DUF4623 domain-containing protein [Muribaculaceae bacterium]|nr:DUF4623 domain-containing protein [Muribaculaceae bacterium]
MKRYKSVALNLCMAVALAGISSACNDDDTNYDNPSGETIIYNISVANGGLTGAENIPGELDEETGTIQFIIPAETDIQAVRFSAKLSLGARLDRDTYDVSSGTTDITVQNNQNESVYHARFVMLDPKETPVLTAIQCKDASGNICTGFVSDVTGTVYLNCEGSVTAEPVSVAALPRRTAYTFTNMHDGVISADDPGKLELDFMGLTMSYDISFAGVPTFGGDFAEARIFDYSAHEGSMIYADYEAENTRWTQFDGERLLVVSRQGGTNPKVLLWDEVAAGSPVDHMLDKTGIAGGTFEVSSGSLAHGHIYICNLTTGLADAEPLKIYHWADHNAVCETVLDFPGNDAVKGRWGDNMSSTIDEQGNGYLWFFDHAAGGMAVRFKVEGFTGVSAEPEVVIPPYSVAYYGAINPVIGEDGVYTLTSTYQRAILLVDRDLNVINIVDAKEGCDYPGTAETDARVVNFNGERYMLTTNCYGWSNRFPQTLRVYDLSAGLNTALSFTNFSDSDRNVLWEYNLNGGNCSAFSANTGAGIGPDGKLRIMAAAPRAGFVLVEVGKKL